MAAGLSGGEELLRGTSSRRPEERKMMAGGTGSVSRRVDCGDGEPRGSCESWPGPTCQIFAVKEFYSEAIGLQFADTRSRIKGGPVTNKWYCELCERD